MQQGTATATATGRRRVHTVLPELVGRRGGGGGQGGQGLVEGSNSPALQLGAEDWLDVSEQSCCL